METQNTVEEEKARSEGLQLSMASEARANVAAEKYLARLPKMGKHDFDQMIAGIARASYLAGRGEVILDIMKSI
jgi:hypothetical protein